MYVLLSVFFGAGYVLGKSQNSPGGWIPRSSSMTPNPQESAAKREDQFGHLKLVLVALHEWRGRSLDTAHMDALLSLDDIPSEETKRSRRARLVSDLNAWAWTEMDKPVLTRVRDEEDRRRTLYVVDEFDLPSWVSKAPLPED